MQFETLHALRDQLADTYEPWVDNSDDQRNAPFTDLDRRLLPSARGIQLNSETLWSMLAKPINTYQLQLALLASLYSHVPYLKFRNQRTLEEAVYSVVADRTIHPLPIGLKRVVDDAGFIIDLPVSNADRYRSSHPKQLMGIVHTHPGVERLVKPSIIDEDEDGNFSGDLYAFSTLDGEALRQGPASPLPYAVKRPVSIIVQPAVDFQSVGILCFREGARFRADLKGDKMINKLYEMKKYLSAASSQGEVKMMLEVGGYNSSYLSFAWEAFFAGYPLFSQDQLTQLTDELLD